MGFLVGSGNGGWEDDALDFLHLGPGASPRPVPVLPAQAVPIEQFSYWKHSFTSSNAILVSRVDFGFVSGTHFLLRP